MRIKTQFLLKALVAGSIHPQAVNLTEADIIDVFAPLSNTILGRIDEALEEILPTTGFSIAMLGVKWGTDDPTEAPEPIGPVEYVLNFPGWDVSKYANQVRVSPKGPGSSGAGDAVIWFKEADPNLHTLLATFNNPTVH